MQKVQKRKCREVVSLVMVAFMLLLLAIPSTTIKAATTKSYTFSNMTYQSNWGVTYNISNGSGSFSFGGQYREIKFALPETLDMSQCSAVTFNASSTSGNIAFKLYDTAGKQAAVRYNFSGSTSDCTFSPNSTAKVNSIGIMCMSTSNISAKVNRVTFTMNGSDSGTGNNPGTTPTPGGNSGTATLLNTYGALYGKSGAAVTSGQLNNSSTMNVIKQQYNSVTIENEMKPDAVLGGSANLMSVSSAKSKGYFIPSGYTESNVPTLNFNTIDGILKNCYNNGLSLRAHCLVWHSQTPDWFFRTGYSGNGAYVSSSVMNARMEMFIKSYMGHIHNSTYGSVVYAWDVVNEYLHANGGGWSKVYGSNLGTSPSFVKSAFQYAYECLDGLGLNNSVSLFYNDYNTYEVADKIISLVKYINSGTKYCDGVGMQAHLATNYPSAASFKTTMQTFLNAGLEVQITELDVTNSSASAQATYVYDLLTAVNSLKKAGGKITGITWWGLYDSVSWRSSQKPLLFSSLTSPKESFRSAIKAYTDAGYKY